MSVNSMQSLQSIDSTSASVRGQERRDQAKEKRLKARALKQEQKLEREAFMRKFLNREGFDMTSKKKQSGSYGATSTKTNEVSATLRKIGKALEYCFSKQERQDLVGVSENYCCASIMFSHILLYSLSFWIQVCFWHLPYPMYVFSIIVLMHSLYDLDHVLYCSIICYRGGI